MKWVGGCLLAILVVVAGGMWWGFRTLKQSTNPDGSVSVTIGAPPSRVFASLADADSLSTWRARGNVVSAFSHGPLAPGDTFRIQMPSGPGLPQQHLTWMVDEIIPDQVIALHLLNDTTGKNMGSRRDSLYAIGDSTVVSSRVLPPSGGVPDTGASGMLFSLFQMQSKLELMSLKARIEGTERVRPEPQRP